MTRNYTKRVDKIDSVIIENWYEQQLIEETNYGDEEIKKLDSESNQKQRRTTSIPGRTRRQKNPGK